MSRTTSSTKAVPLLQTPEPRDVPGAWFDPAAVDRVVRFFRHLRHTKGLWAGRPFEPEPWQVEYLLAPVFGWKHADGRRIVRTAWWEFPRKNGKSTLASGIGLYLLVSDREEGAEVVAAAASKDQARYVFDPARTMARTADELLADLLLPLASTIVYERKNAAYRVVSSVGDLKMGADISGATIDEVHVHKDRGLIDTLETSTGSREQPLVVMLTTADEGEPGTIYDEKRQYLERLCKGIIEDPTFYGVVFAASPEDPPFSMKTLRRANPGFGVTVKKDYLEAQVRKAKASPAYLNTYLRLHLGVRTRQAVRWIPMDVWDATAGMVVAEKLVGRECFGGLHVASTTEINAFVLVFRDEVYAESAWSVLPTFWLPKDDIVSREKRDMVPYRRWAKAGKLVLTEGNVTDYDRIRRDVESLVERYGPQEVAYSRFASSPQLALDLGAAGVAMVAVSPTIQRLSPPSKELLRAIRSGRLQHSAHPVLRWQADAVAAKTQVLKGRVGDRAAEDEEYVAPDPARSQGPIPGIVGLVLALERALVALPRWQSAYEERGVMSV